jgi:hypothetical protein
VFAEHRVRLARNSPGPALDGLTTSGAGADRVAEGDLVLNGQQRVRADPPRARAV